MLIQIKKSVLYYNENKMKELIINDEQHSKRIIKGMSSLKTL